MIRFVNQAEVLSRESEFRACTEGPGSDMNVMLDRLISGKVTQFVAVVIEDGSRLVGWASAYTWGEKSRHMMDVYVCLGARCCGFGRRLVQALLDENARLAYPQPIADDDPKSFWAAFEGQVVPVSVAFAHLL